MASILDNERGDCGLTIMVLAVIAALAALFKCSHDDQKEKEERERKENEKAAEIRRREETKAKASEEERRRQRELAEMGFIRRNEGSIILFLLVGGLIWLGKRKYKVFAAEIKRQLDILSVEQLEEMSKTFPMNDPPIGLTELQLYFKTRDHGAIRGKLKLLLAEKRELERILKQEGLK